MLLKKILNFFKLFCKKIDGKALTLGMRFGILIRRQFGLVSIFARKCDEAGDCSGIEVTFVEYVRRSGGCVFCSLRISLAQCGNRQENCAGFDFGPRVIRTERWTKKRGLRGNSGASPRQLTCMI